MVHRPDRRYPLVVLAAAGVAFIAAYGPQVAVLLAHHPADAVGLRADDDVLRLPVLAAIAALCALAALVGSPGETVAAFTIAGACLTAVAMLAGFSLPLVAAAAVVGAGFAAAGLFVTAATGRRGRRSR